MSGAGITHFNQYHEFKAARRCGKENLKVTGKRAESVLSKGKQRGLW